MRRLVLRVGVMTSRATPSLVLTSVAMRRCRILRRMNAICIVIRVRVVRRLMRLHLRLVRLGRLLHWLKGMGM